MHAHQTRFVVKIRNGAAADAQVTRADILEGFEEAIDLARDRANPAGMLAGWREIARMCGYCAPEREEVHVNVARSTLQNEIERMSGADLLVLAAKY